MTTAADDLRDALSAEEGGRLWLRRLAIFGVAATIIAAGLGWRVTHRPTPPPKYVIATVATGDVTESVQATGAVQPLLQVNVGAQINGRVTRVPVDFNSVVRGPHDGLPGDVLAEIDPTLYGQQVTQAQAAVQAQRAALDSAKGTLEQMRAAYDRTTKLYAQNLASRADVDTAKGNLDVALAAIASANAQIASMNAQLSQSVTNVGFTKIYSPVDGIVVTRGIDPGATVVASFQSPVLFVIAQDLRKMRVLADIDEADVGKLREKMEADGSGRRLSRRDVPRRRAAGPVQPEQRRGRRHVLGRRRGREPRGEAPPGDDGDGHDQDARSQERAPHPERRTPLQAHPSSWPRWRADDAST